jgi:hypothetical protein
MMTSNRLMRFCDCQSDRDILRERHKDSLARCRDDLERARWEIGYDTAIQDVLSGIDEDKAAEARKG